MTQVVYKTSRTDRLEAARKLGLIKSEVQAWVESGDGKPLEPAQRRSLERVAYEHAQARARALANTMRQRGNQSSVRIQEPEERGQNPFGKFKL